MTYAGFRDAIHVPFILVTCGKMLMPGDRVMLRHGNTCEKWDGLEMWHGVADPFSEPPINAGELFRVFIRKECFTKLRHDFEIEVHDRGGTATCHNVCDIF